jgi:hypothetical protein
MENIGTIDLKIMKNKAHGFFISNMQNGRTLLGDEETLENLNLDALKGKARKLLLSVLADKPNAKMFLEYYTNAGWITNGEILNGVRDINLREARTENAKIDDLMRNPRISKNRPSEMSNSRLEGKEVYGIRVSVFS